MVAHQIALEAGCDTALLVDENTDRVLETPVMSFVWLRQGALRTPPLSDGILDGITRRVLLETTKCAEHPTTLDDLQTCDAAAVLSTNAEMKPVHALRGLIARELPIEPITSHCRQLSDAIAETSRR
jgi:branched-subunit amino acid aminotransferase/4-amino-4-deoxychorismate lyase